jgi:hypothetical protein
VSYLNRIYSIGGYTGTSTLTNQMYYNSGAGWTLTTPLPSASAFGSASVNGTNLYYFSPALFANDAVVRSTLFFC